MLVPHFRAFGEPAAAAPPPPSAEVLAQQAIADLSIPDADDQHRPRPGQVRTWLWVDQAAPVSATVSAGGVSVTATATLTSTTWTLGEPGPLVHGPGG